MVAGVAVMSERTQAGARIHRSPALGEFSGSCAAALRAGADPAGITRPTEEDSPDMFQRSMKVTALVAATAAAGFSGAAIAGAADSTSPSSSSTTGKRAAGGPGAGETALTGATKEKVEAAALAKVKGTVVRTETDDGGVYESHIRKSDGTEVEVKVGKDFQVTSVQSSPAGGRGGHGGPGGRGGMHAELTAVAKALGVTEAKLRTAVEAARPDRAANGARPDHGAEIAAALAKSLGKSTADVQAVLDANRQAGGRGPGDESALVSALVSKLSVTKEQAQAAVDAARKAQEAEHTARETAMYAAVAKALGKDADAVQKAFDASRPTQPTP
jgi:uncharacterized membrane protein YkoI